MRQGEEGIVETMGADNDAEYRQGLGPVTPHVAAGPAESDSDQAAGRHVEKIGRQVTADDPRTSGVGEIVRVFDGREAETNASTGDEHFELVAATDKRRQQRQQANGLGQFLAEPDAKDKIPQTIP